MLLWACNVVRLRYTRVALLCKGSPVTKKLLTKTEKLTPLIKICAVSNSLFLTKTEEKYISRRSSVRERRQDYDSMSGTFSTE
jgi:hypothetical protein